MATKNAASFDGTNDYLTRGADLTGSADSKLWSGSLWFKRGVTLTQETLLQGEAGRYRIFIQSDDTLRFQGRNSANDSILIKDTNTAITDTSAWHHICWSFDMAGGSHIFLDDVDVESSGGIYTDDTLDFTLTNHAVGANTDGNRTINACLSEVWMEFGASFDFSVEGNRRKFISSDTKAVGLGSDGSTPNGTSPILYLSNAFGTFEQNNGGGDDYSVTGALTDCVGPEAASTTSEETAAAVAGGAVSVGQLINITQPTVLAGGPAALSTDNRVDQASVGGGLADVTVMAIGGAASLNVTSAAAGLAGATELKLGTSVSTFCLLLEDNSSKLLLEDDASCIIIDTGGSVIIAAAIAAGLMTTSKAVNLRFALLGGAVAASIVAAAKRVLAFSVLAGGLAVRQTKIDLALKFLASGITKHQKKISRVFAFMAGGLANAQTALAGALTAIAAAAVAGGLPKRVLKRLIPVAATVGALIVTVVDLLPKTFYSGSGGLGSVSQLGRGWVSWRDKSRTR